MTILDDLRAAKRAVGTQLLQLGRGGDVIARRSTISVASLIATAGRNVHAVGVGHKLVAGKEVPELALRFYVVQKLPNAILPPRDRLPETVSGLPTDVLVAEPAFVLAKRTSRGSGGGSRGGRRRTGTGNVTAARVGDPPGCSAERRHLQRPVIGGISAGHRDITVGTLGCLCRSRRVGDDPAAVFALSNNHVFADLNRALIGDPLYQPGTADGGVLESHFANLHRYVVLFLGGTVPNRVDAAIGQLLGSVAFTPEICTIGRMGTTLAGEVDLPVRKHGRTTGYTAGRIDDADCDLLVGVDPGDPSVVALFQDQLRIVSDDDQPIGLGGDSGSAVVHASRDALVGLYFAGPSSGSYGVANRIEHVFAELEVDLLN